MFLKYFLKNSTSIHSTHMVLFLLVIFIVIISNENKYYYYNISINNICNK